MSSVAAPFPDEQPTLSPLIAEAARRARRRRLRYATIAVIVVAGIPLTYFNVVGGSGTNSTAIVHAGNGTLTLIGRGGISAVGSGGRLRQVFSRCEECDDYRSFGWSRDGRRLAFSVWVGPGAATVAARDGLHVVDLATGRDEILDAPPNGLDIAWSPAGTAFAYESGQTLYVVRADGGGYSQLPTGTAGNDSSPSWSPDGTRIVYETWSPKYGVPSIHIIGVDGSNKTLLARNASAPAWSPVMFRDVIAYRTACGIKLIASSGRHLTPRCLGLTGDPVWSPDGTKIAFSHQGPAIAGASGTYAMNADGSRLVRVSLEGLGGYLSARPAWRPVATRS